jgi:hypothetical protein
MLLYCIYMSACVYMNQVCQDNKGMQVGEPSYDFGDSLKILS